MKLIKVENTYILQDMEMNKKIFDILDNANEYDYMNDIIEDVESVFLDEDEYFFINYYLIGKCTHNNENEYFIFIKNLSNNEILKVCIFEIF